MSDSYESSEEEYFSKKQGKFKQIKQRTQNSSIYSHSNQVKELLQRQIEKLAKQKSELTLILNQTILNCQQLNCEVKKLKRKLNEKEMKIKAQSNEISQTGKQRINLLERTVLSLQNRIQSACYNANSLQSHNRNLLLQIEKLYQQIRLSSAQKAKLFEQKTVFFGLQEQLQKRMQDIVCRQKATRIKQIQLQQEKYRIRELVTHIQQKLRSIAQVQTAIKFQKSNLSNQYSKLDKQKQLLRCQSEKVFDLLNKINHTQQPGEIARKAKLKQLNEAQNEIAELRKQLIQFKEQSNPIEAVFDQQNVSISSILKFVKAIDDLLVSIGRSPKKGRLQKRLKNHWRQIKRLVRADCD